MGADRVGVIAQAVAGRRLVQYLEDARRGRVGVLVGVALNDLALERLLARGGAGPGANAETQGVEYEWDSRNESQPLALPLVASHGGGDCTSGLASRQERLALYLVPGAQPSPFRFTWRTFP